MAEDDERRSNRNKPGRREAARGARRDLPVIEGQASDVSDAVQSDALGRKVDADASSSPEGSAIVNPVPNSTHPEPAAPEEPLDPLAEEHRPPPPLEGEPAFPSAGLGSYGTERADTFPAASSLASERPPEGSAYGTSDPYAVSAASNAPNGNTIQTLLGIGLVILLLAVIYLFYSRSSESSENSAALAGMGTRVATLEARPVPAPPDLSGLDQKISADAAAVSSLKGDLDALGKRVDDVASAKPAGAPDLGPQFAAVDQKIGDLQRDLATLRSTVENLPKPDFAPIDAKIGDVDARVGAVDSKVGAVDDKVGAVDKRVSSLQDTVGAIPRVDLGPVVAQIHDLDGRLKPVESDVAAARSPQRVAEARAAPLAVTAQAVTDAIAANRPFGPELGALQALGADQDRLAPLRAVAGEGAPSLADLQTDLGRVRNAIVANGTAPPTGSYVDRLVAGAGALVQVRPLGTVVGDSPGAIADRIHAEIGSDDLAAALADWQKLPELSRSVSKGLADRIKLRLDAETAAKSIAAQAVSAMAPKG